MISSKSNRWGLVLAGGDGTRLKSFTKLIAAIVGLFPSDHYFGNEARFAEYADSAFSAAADSEVAVLLAEATAPEQAYGWDLGEPARVIQVARQIGVSPQWAVA